MITEEQIEILLREVRDGASIKDAATTAGVHRPRVYTLRDRDAVFAARLADAREQAKPLPVAEPPPHARPRSGRLTPAMMTPRQRRLLRDLLDVWDAPPEPHEMTAQERTRWALDQWLANREWPDGAIDEAALGKLSRRALADYRHAQLVREAERAANDSRDAVE